MKVLVLLGLMASLLIAEAKTAWYSAIALSEEQISDLMQRECYRGLYGGVRNADFVNSRSLSLFTCPLFSTDQPFAEVEDDTFLCVVELGSTHHMEASIDVIIKHRHTEVLFQGTQEIVIVATNNTGRRHEKPDLCAPPHFGGLADNTMFVPRFAMIPQQAPPVDHPAYIRSMLQKEQLAPNPYIAQLMAQFDRARVTEQVRQLTTGRDGSNTMITRNSYAIQVGRAGCLANWKCANDATQYVVSSLNTMFANYPGPWRVTTNTFRADMCANVVLELTGVSQPNRYILTGAHLDSRNTGSGPTATGVAPGADDNGSGSAVHLELARVIAANNVRFQTSIRLMWFCGEEQGLLGSDALARAYASQNPRLDVIGMFNMDMIGYTNPPSGVVLSFMTGSATPWLSTSCKEFSRTYIPSMAVGDTQACCSDQQSFFRAGFPAAGIFETPTARVVYPQYHMTTDTFTNTNINYEQIWRFGQAISVCAMEYAIPVPPSTET